MDKELLRKYWEDNLDPANLGRASRGLDIEQEVKFYLSPEQSWVYSLWRELADKLVLELGGAIGVNATILANKGARVVVVDLSINRLKFLREILDSIGLSDKVWLVCSTAEQIGIKNEVFDLAYTKSVLIHTELVQALSEIKRVLKKEGEAIFCEPQQASPFAWFYRHLFAPAVWRRITRYFDRHSARQVKEAFPMCQVRHFYFFSFLAFFWQYAVKNLALFHFWVRILNVLDVVLFRLFPFLRPLAWFAIFRVKKLVNNCGDLS